jgi:hypothetical protein
MKLPKLDRSKFSSIKAYLTLIILLIAAYFLFDAAGNNFYSTLKNKTDLLKTIADLKKDASNDTLLTGYLRTLETTVIKKRTFYENAIDYFKYVFVYGYHSEIADNNRSGFLQFVTSSWLLLVSIIYAPFSRKVKTNLFQETVLNVKTIGAVLAIGLVNSYIFGLIPVIGWPIVNYFINSVLQYAEVKLFSYFSTKKYVLAAEQHPPITK